MKKVSWALVLLLSVALGAISAKAQNESPWDEFLQHPDDTSLARLNETTSFAVRCQAGVAPYPDQRNELFKLIREGNERAFRAALLVSSCWDGADSEDFYRSAGAFLECDPRRFLEAEANSDVSVRQLGPMATMLPLETVDKIDIRLKMVELRISRLETVDDPRLTIVKTLLLDALDREKKELTEDKKELLKERASLHQN